VIARMPLVAVTLRGVLGRRRTWLMILLASLPVILALLIRAGNGHVVAPTVLDNLLIRIVMPLLALVFGTAALGSELEDGTAIYLIVKPISRSRILLAKMAVGAGLTVALVVPATILTALITGGREALSAPETIGYALVVAAGGIAYACAFVTLSAFTGRALIVGLCYVLLWEGVLAGLLEGTRFLSIRQATLGLAAQVTGTRAAPPPLDVTISVAILVIVIVGAVVLGGWKLSRFEVRGGD
jgi:ABC-2 type transport system permease protein